LDDPVPRHRNVRPIPLAARQGDEARAVGELELGLIAAQGANGPLEGLIACQDFAVEFATLAFRRGHEQDERAGAGEQLVQGEGGDGGRFAGLSRTIEEHARSAIQEQLALPGIGIDALSAQRVRRIHHESERMSEVQRNDQMLPALE